jgi:hypothetical protein
MENKNEVKLLKHQQIIYDLVMNYDYESGVPLKICLNWGRGIGATTLIEKILKSGKFKMFRFDLKAENFLKHNIKQEEGCSVKKEGDADLFRENKLKASILFGLPSESDSKNNFDFYISVMQQPIYNIKRMIQIYSEFDIVDIKNQNLVRRKFVDLEYLKKEFGEKEINDDHIIIWEYIDQKPDLKKEYVNLVKEYKQCTDEKEMNKLHNKIKVLTCLVDAERRILGTE